MISTPSLLHLIHRIGQTGNELFAERVADGLTLSQALILNGIAAQPQSNQTALVGATGIDRSTVAEIMKRLVRRGLVKRRRSRSDTRAYVVDITDEGRLALEQAVQAISAVEGALLVGIPEKHRKQFLAWLVVMAEPRDPDVN